MQILKDEVKNEIEQTAKKFFLENGYEKTSLRAIAKSANVSKSNIYNYYENKEQLFESITKNIRQNIENFNLIFDEHTFSDAPFGSERFICNLSEQLFEYILSNREDFLLLMKSSEGTPFEQVKTQIVSQLSNHIKKELSDRDDSYDYYIIDIVSINFIEGLIKIAWKRTKINDIKNDLMNLVKYHVKGMTSLIQG